MHASHQPTQLAQLLTACTVGVALTTAAAAAVSGAGTGGGAEQPHTPTAAGRQAAPGPQLDSGTDGAGASALAHCWAPDGALGAKLQLALDKCGALLAERAKAPAGFLGAELQRLAELAAALAGYWRALRSRALADSLLR